MRDQRLYLRDIFTAMVAIQEFIAEMDFETFGRGDSRWAKSHGMNIMC